MKELGFKTSTTSGLSIGITDLRIPESKLQLIEATQQKVERVERAYEAGAITERERHNRTRSTRPHTRPHEGAHRRPRPPVGPAGFEPTTF